MLCKLDKNAFVPNVIKNNLVLPAKAFAQTSINTLQEPVENILSSVQKTYADELAKSESEYLHLHLNYNITYNCINVFIQIAVIIIFLHGLRGK